MKFIKKNYLIIISFLILLIPLIFSTTSYLKSQKNIAKKEYEFKEFCSKEDYHGKEYEEYCDELLSKEDIKIDFYTVYTNVVLYALVDFSLFFFLFIIIPSVYNTSKYLKNKIILQDATRMSYKKIKSKIFFESYKSIVILPLIVIIGFIISYALSKTFDPTYAIKYKTIFWTEKTVSNPIVFMFLYLCNVIFNCTLYINISLIIVRKHHNYFVAVILSFLTYVAFEAFLEIGIYAILFNSILKSSAGVIFNIMNAISFNDKVGVFPLLSVTLSFAIISSIIVYFKYKDKELLIIDCERND